MAKHYSFKQENKQNDSIGGVHKQIMIKIAAQSFQYLQIIVNGYAKARSHICIFLLLKQTRVEQLCGYVEQFYWNSDESPILRSSIIGLSERPPTPEHHHNSVTLHRERSFSVTYPQSL